MNPIPLHHVWSYTDVDRAFWAEHLEGWLPRRIVDSHTHMVHPQFRLRPMTETKRRQYWVNEVLEPIDALTFEQCHRMVFPGRDFGCVAFGLPELDFDIEGENSYVRQECAQRGWHSLAVLRPQWSQDLVAGLLATPGVIGLKPYYSMISSDPETRDRHLEASIFEFLPHHVLEVANGRHAWVTLHVPKAGRLSQPDNVREIREIRERYPNIVLVIAHLGRCYTEPHAREALPQFADDPGLYFDTSAVVNPACHRVALECLGPRRLLYGSDNPIMYMRGRRQCRGRAYVNRTSHPFHFNRDREGPAVEAGYTLFMYEDLRAIKQACAEIGIASREEIGMIFHANADRLIAGILARKPPPPREEKQ
ncbi:MAG TPA: amidohydrolase family protein [Candidatus Paceibacterota bacterium]|nr:amidohydrolase family protein [Verrucomicrobiota bacterium]HSA11159.1 amidohydrolase family protein [Candidatus Paceibacterota bacterium]